jgi:RNA polymerase sigma factor (sigma-70 family)
MTAPPKIGVDDATLIEQSRDEPERFAEIYDRHAGPIHRYVARRLGIAAADDIVAETFLAAFHGRRRYQRQHPDARPWLYGIAANLISRQRRSEVRMLRALARSPIEPAHDDADRSDDRLSAAAVQRDLAAALSDLAARDRDVLLLIAWADLSYHEVAEALDIPIGTVRSRLNRARNKVRHSLGDHDPTSL